MELSLNTLSALDDLPNHFEVLNAGMHHDADNEVNVFAYYVAPPLVRDYDVDLVLIMQDETPVLDAFMHKPITSEGIPSDKIDPEYLLKPNREKFKSEPLHHFFELCRDKKLLAEASSTVWTFTDMNALVLDPEVRGSLEEIMGKPLLLLLKKMDSIKTTGGKPSQVIFCYFPTTLSPLKEWRSFWREVCEKSGIPFLDLSDDFTAVGYSFYPYQAWESGHFTVNGMYLFSTLMTHELLRNGMIPTTGGTIDLKDH
jgi:hypothetical protein